MGAARWCADDVFYLKQFLSDGEVAPSNLRVFAVRTEIIQGRDGQQCLDPSNFRPYHFSPGDMNVSQLTCPLFVNWPNRRWIDNWRANHSQIWDHDETNENSISISPFEKKHDRKFLQVYRLSKTGSDGIALCENAPSLICMISGRAANCLRQLERV